MAWRMLLAAGLALACGLAGWEAVAQDPQRISGAASYYSKDYEGIVTSGVDYDAKKFTAAHRTLPFGTRLRVTDPKTHLSVTVTVNDRGPFDKGLVLDLSYAAAQALHMTERGIIEVTATVE
jgi:rare lipoprotein A